MEHSAYKMIKMIKDTNNSDPESTINKELQNINDYMIFYTPQKRVKPLGLEIENTIVEIVYEFNFLGLILNENLN